MSVISSNSLGLADGPRMLVSPASVFRRLAERSAYGWALGAMLLVITMIGWATVKTGLIELEVNRQTGKALAELEREQSDLLSRLELSKRMEKVRETGEFNKLILQGGAVAYAPIALVATLMLLAAILFAVVALAGNKPDYPTLMAVLVYSAVIDVAAAALRLAMMLWYRTMEVDTSLGLLVSVSEETATLHRCLSAIDPFRVWFWILVGVGLVLTGQLSRRVAGVTCAVFALLAIGVRMIPWDSMATGPA
ncbi:MAG: YIP1 family protein [Planctomycetes bacterium]|nr:YIP1 family protein [Planctomycetota bacterium]